MKATIKHGPWGGPYTKEEAEEVKEDILPWHRQGLIETATGYGGKLTTDYKVKHQGRWHRVYCACYSNSGTTYIIIKKVKTIVDIER